MHNGTIRIKQLLTALIENIRIQRLHCICATLYCIQHTHTHTHTHTRTRTRTRTHAHTHTYVTHAPTVVQSYPSTFHHINKTTWSGHQYMTSPLQVPQLTTKVCSSVEYTWTNSRSISKLQAEKLNAKSFYNPYCHLVGIKINF